MKLLGILLSFLCLSCVTRLNKTCEAPAEYRDKAVATIFNEAKRIVERPSEKKAIAFCVYGSRPHYTHGLLENIDIAKDQYPGWDVVVFLDSKTVPQDIIDQAKAKGAKVYVDPKYNAAAVRFYVADMDYDRFISRDADSRIYPREVAAVADWMQYPWATLHNMRDVKLHVNPMLAGMWGAQVKPLREKLKAAYGTDNMEKLYTDFLGGKKAKYGDDELFLKEVVLKAVGLDNFLTHESVICNAFPHSRGFPVPRGSSGVHIGGIRNIDQK